MKKSEENQRYAKGWIPSLPLTSIDEKAQGDSRYAKQRGSVELEEELSLLQLKKLMRLFKQHKPEQKYKTFNLLPPASRHARKPGLMNVDEFKKALNKAFQKKDGVLAGEIDELFRKVDISSDGLVDWDELSSYILLRLQEREVVRSSSSGKVFQAAPKIVKMEKCKEPTSRILLVSNPSRYVTVSKDGIIRIWTTDLVLQKLLSMENGDQSLSQSTSSKRNIWVTDAVVMKNVNKMTICTTNMDMYFYDMSTPVYTLQFHLCALGVVAFCMEYHYDKMNPAGQSLLFYGDDKGQVHMLIFHKPFQGLFDTPFKKHEGYHTVYLQEAVASLSRLVSHVLVDDLHSDWLRRLRYYPSNDVLLSCSGNGRDSLIMRGVLKNAHDKVYIYKVSKGIDCFDYSKDFNVMATGGLDHVVRLWNPYVTAKPVAILRGHISRVLDVIIDEKMGSVFSYDCDTVIKAWNIKEHYCIQSIHLKYPYNLQHLEHGPFPMILLPSVHALLIACEDYLTEIKLHDEPRSKLNRTSHERPLCAVIYNEQKKQVITGCEASLVRTWNVETGKKVFEFLGVRGKDEMSCMALEISGRRLFTGSRTGIVYIWTSGNGQLLHKCLPEPGYECEVTAIQPLPDKSYTLSVGWSRRIVMYHDHVKMLTVEADPSWKGGHVHEDDILCIAHCHPNFVATGSFDGDLILWSLERQNIFKRLKRGSGSLFKSKLKKVGLAAGNKRLKSDNKQGMPIDAILFFEKRAHIKYQDGAILVSSQCGVLEFWSIFGPLRPRGRFYAPYKPGCAVGALATDQHNDILFSGDTAGQITMWDIREYCNSSLEVTVTKAWVTTKTQASPEEQQEYPPQQCRWQAHTKTVVSLQVVDNFTEKFILSASTDCTAKLWTISGILVGVFGQGPVWGLRECFAPQLAHEKSRETLASGLDNINIAASNKVRPHTTGDVFTSNSQPLFKAPRKVTSEKANDESFSLHRSLTESCILGDKYNKTFERRMMDRKNRRDNLGHVDTSLTTGGGLGTSCSPFQALHVLSSNEFELPRDLPMTPRMKTGSKVFREESWPKNLTSLNLPPILSEDDN